MSCTLLKNFYSEVDKNRSNILSFNFEKTWKELDLNPDLMNTPEINPCKIWYNNVYQFHFIERILAKNEKNEIFLHRESDLSKVDFFYALENIALRNGHIWNTSTPYLSMFLNIANENLRLTLIHSSITSDKAPRAFIRRLSSKSIDIEQYACSQELVSFISSKKNIIVSGSTGSGKTTLLQSLLSLCPNNEHLVIMEDTHEIFLKDKNTTHLLSDERNTLVDFCSYVLRLSPDRIILGELRGAEVLPMVLTMNTGHKGFLSTIHANNASSALNRIKTLLDFFSKGKNSSFEMVCQNIDIIIHMENKKIKEIISVHGMDENRPMYDYIFKSTS